MKKSMLLALTAATLGISLGIATPTFATASQTSTAAPSSYDINRALTAVKSLHQYYEYAALIKSVNTNDSLGLKTHLTAIDSTLPVAGKTTNELITLAKNLPNYNIYVYLYNLVANTENWLNNYYASASNADRQEAYDAANDAAIASQHLLGRQTANKTSDVNQRSVAATSATQSQSVAQVQNAVSTPAPQTNEVASTTPAPVASTEAVAPVAKTSSTTATTAPAGGAVISVTVVANDEATADGAGQTDEETATAPLATNLTYAATATSLAGAVLATKRSLGKRR